MCFIQDAKHKTKATKCAMQTNQTVHARLLKSQFTDNIRNVELVIII